VLAGEAIYDPLSQQERTFPRITGSHQTKKQRTQWIFWLKRAR